jgi:hypothetical protein
MEDPPVNLKKPRKPLSQESLDKLAKARQKANAIRAEATKKKLEGKLEKINTQVNEVLPPKEEPPPDPPPSIPDPMDVPSKEIPPPPEPEPEPDIEEDEVKIVKKATNTKKKGKKPVVIVEQESDESDFDDNDRVIFVKRRTQKPKKKTDDDEQPLPTTRTEPPQSLPPPVRRQPATIPQKTPHEILMEQQYNQMFNGGFLNRNKFY